MMMPAPTQLAAMLDRLERFHRLLALSLLDAAAEAGVRSPALVEAVAGLDRPSWSTWNRLVLAIRAARRQVLRSGTAAERDAVAGSTVLQSWAAELDRPVEPSLDALAGRVQFALPPRPKLIDALSLPIGLRNRLAHDAPTDPGYFDQAIAELAPLETLVGSLPEPRPGSPWRTSDGAVFDGLEKGFRPRRLTAEGSHRIDADSEPELAAAFARAVGATSPAADLRALIRTSAPEELKGVLLGPVVVGRSVGRGGFATVHEGRLVATGQRVAVKLLHDASDEARERLRREAEFLAAVSHPNIVSVAAWGEEAWSAPRQVDLSGEAWFQELSRGPKRRSFLALEWVDGPTLDAICTSPKPPPQSEALRWLAEAASALAAVHDAGLVHRDVKPSNLMLTSAGQVKLMDFGIATTAQRGANALTRAGEAVGSPAYMSPEQLRAASSDPVGPAADQYGLCAAFYEVFTGRRVFDHDQTGPDVMTTRKLAGETPAPPRSFDGRLSWEIETVLLAGLQPDPRDRYPDLHALRRDVLHALAHEPIEHRRPSLWRRAQLSYRRNTAQWLVALAAAVLLLAGGVQFIRAAQAERAQAQAHRARAEHDRVRAEDASAEAQQRLGAVREARGRAAFLAGDGQSAALFLADAYRLGRQGAGPRVMLGNVLASTRALIRTVPPGEDPQRSGWWTSEGLLTVTRGGKLSWIDPATGSERRMLVLGPEVKAVNPPLQRAFVAPDRLIDLTTGAEVARLAGVAGEVGFYGPWLVGMTRDAISLWDAQGRPGATIRFQGAVRLLSPNPSGGVVAVSTQENVRTTFYDARTGKELGSLPKVSALAWLDDGRALVDDWDKLFIAAVPGFARSAPLPRPAFSGSDRLLVAPDGRHFIAGNASALTLWQVDPPAPLRELPETGFVSNGSWTVSFSGDGHRLAVAGASNVARVFSAEDGAELARVTVDANRISGAILSSDGARLVTVHTDGAQRTWDVSTAQPPREWIVPFVAQAVAVGDGVALAGGYGDTAMISLADGKPRRLGIGGELGVAVQGGAAVAVSSHGLALVDLSADGRIRWKDEGEAFVAASLSADGARVFAASYRELLLLDARDGKALAKAEQSGAAWRLALGGGGRFLVAVNDGIQVRRADDLSLVRTQPCSAFQPPVAVQGELLAYACGGEAEVVRLEDGARRFRLDGVAGVIKALAFDAAGRALATVSDAGVTTLWSVDVGRSIATLVDDGSPLSTVTFDPTGELVVTSGAKGAVLWDVRAGAKLLALAGGSDFAPRFSSNGEWLAYGAGGVRLLRLPREERPPEEVTRAAEALSGQRLVDGEVAGSLKP